MARKPKVKVAYQGEPGAYSECAALELFGTRNGVPLDRIECVGKAQFEEVFDAVDLGRADFGILPFENTLGGSIHTNYGKRSQSLIMV